MGSICCGTVFVYWWRWRTSRDAHLYLHAHCRLVQDHAASTARKNCRSFTVLLDNSQLLVLAPPLLWENHDDNSDEMSTASRMNEPNYMIELH